MKVISFCLLLGAFIILDLSSAKTNAKEGTAPSEMKNETHHPSNTDPQKPAPLDIQGHIEDRITKPETLYTIEGSFDDKRKLPAEVTIYLKITGCEVELITCQNKGRSNELSKILPTIFDHADQAERFREKGFKFETSKENCTGIIYYEKEEVGLNSIKHLLNSLDHLETELPINLNKAAAESRKGSSIELKIQAKKDATAIEYVYHNIQHGFLAKESKWPVPNGYWKSFRFGSGRVEVDDGSARRGSAININVALNGKGLHQSITKRLSLREDNVNQWTSSKKKCSIVLLDILSEETYVDQDEIRGIEHMELKRFEVLDIEKPTETAKQYVWMIKMDLDELKKQSESPNELVVTYPVHFRYQSPKHRAYSDSHLLLKTRLFTDCELVDAEEVWKEDVFYKEKVREIYGEDYKEINNLNRGWECDTIVTTVPVGDVGMKEMVSVVTLVVSLAGAAIILISILSGNKKVRVD